MNAPLATDARVRRLNGRRTSIRRRLVSATVGRRGLAKQVGRIVLVVLLLSFVTALLLEFVPGDPAIAILGENATAASVTELRVELGLDRPFFARYGEWLADALRGDLGTSVVPPRGPVADRVLAALPVTVELAIVAQLMALAIAVPVGVWSAARAGSTLERAATASLFGLVSIPTFVSGLILAFLFSSWWPILPRAEWSRLTSDEGVFENLRHVLLPALTLALSEVAIFVKVLREDLLRTLGQDYITAARAKGLSERRVLFSHALRPSSFSLVTISGISVGRLLGGTVIVETIFALPGIGRLMVDAVGKNDFPLVQGTVIVVAVLYVAINVSVDLLYAQIDPRIRRRQARYVT